MTTGRDLPDKVVLGQLGALNVVDLSARLPGRSDRRRTHIRKDGVEPYLVQVMVSGRAVLEQDGRQAALEPGDLVLADGARPTRWLVSGDARVSVVSMPRQLFPLPPNEADRLTAVPVKGGRGTPALAASVIRQVADDLETLERAAGTKLAMSVLDLVSVAFSDTFAVAEPKVSGPDALLARINAFIDDHLADPALGPEIIAAAHHVSVRYLHKLFESQDQTVAATIRRRRLERCRRDLVDPAQATRPVSAIAARWGLRRPAQFSRMFRAAYGISPTAYRAAAGLVMESA